MFTFGIFTTHLPYIAFIFFYAYFLIFGVKKSGEGQIQTSEKSITVESHLNSFNQDSFSNTACYYYAVAESGSRSVIEVPIFKQKWKLYYPDLKPGKFEGSALFCRPPPVLA